MTGGNLNLRLVSSITKEGWGMVNEVVFSYFLVSFDFVDWEKTATTNTEGDETDISNNTEEDIVNDGMDSTLCFFSSHLAKIKI